MFSRTRTVSSSSRTRKKPVKTKTKAAAPAPRKSDPGRALNSRASPPPMDDFDNDVYEEANEYATECSTEKERSKMREENAERKKNGLPPRKLPPKYKKEDKTKVKQEVKEKGKRARPGDEEDDHDSDSSDAAPDGEGFQYEGQTHLNFDPLPILAHIVEGQFDPDEIIRQMDPRHVRTPTPPVRPASVDMGMSMDVDVDPQPSRTTAVPKNAHHIVPNGKPAVTPDVKPDIKPDVMFDVGDDNGEEEEEVEEEEDYGEDDIVVVPWRKTVPLPDAKPVVDQKPIIDSKPTIDQKPTIDSDSNDSDSALEEEQYSEDEFDSSYLHESLTTQQDLLSAADFQALEQETERPRFPCTEEQRQIPPFQLDGDDETVVIPATINRFLRGYQRAGVQFMYTKYRRGMGGLLGDDMGLGKTVQVIAFLSAIMRKTGTVIDCARRKNLIRRTGQRLPPQQWPTALLVCPTSLIGNWSRELETWGYFEYEIWSSSTANSTLKSMAGGYLDIILISHDLVSRAADELKKLPFSVTIVDEAHRMKKMKGLLGLAVKKIPSRSCIALTGTLIQNRMDEMWSVLDFVQRGWVGTLKEWRAYVVDPINKGHRHDATVLEATTYVKRLAEVHSVILPHFYLRRDKRLIADELPKKTDMVVLCPLGARQAAVYKRIIESDDVKFIVLAKEPCDCGSGEKRSKCCFRENSVGDDVRTAILKMFHALGRVANHMALLYQSKDDPPHVVATNKRIFQFCVGQHYDPAKHLAVEAAQDPDNCGKWNHLKGMLTTWRANPEEKNKVLLFSNSVRLLKYIKDFIDTEMSGFDSDLFSGEVDKDERMQIVDRFQDLNSNNFIMLVSTMAGGVGLNLTAANKVIIFDPNWNPANDLQAMDRAFRFGQKRPVEVYRFVSQGTIEEVMYERQIYKQQRARQLNDGTFERRTHCGYEGATMKADKGELFGVHNIFRYDPEGYVKGNLERIRHHEAELRQDLLQQEYESDSDDDDDDDGKAMRNHRRDKALRQARLDEQEQQQEDSLADELFSDGTAGAQPKPKSAASSMDELIKKLGLSTLEHNAAFRDSPEERAVFEKGLQLMLERPDLQNLLANEIGKVRLPSERRAKKIRRADPVVEEEPWKPRLAQREANKAETGNNAGKPKRLVDLDDD